MANLNKVYLMGNLTRDPELRYIPSGAAVATFDMAVNRNYTAQSGEKKRETCYIRIVVWGKMAEVCGEYLSKGSPVLVEGRLQSRSWVSQEGQKRSTIEVVANNVQFLRSKAQAATEAPAPDGQAPPDEYTEENMDQSAPPAQPDTAKSSNKDTEEAPF